MLGLRSIVAAAAFLLGCAESGRGPSATADMASMVDLATSRDIAAPQGDMTMRLDLAGVCGVNRLVINEVQPGTFDPTDEWVELYNPCPNAVMLDGATLKYRSANAVSDTTELASLSGTIAAGGYHVIAGAGFTGTRQQSFNGSGNQLSEIGGAVGIRAPDSSVVDGFGWGSANNIFVETASKTAPIAGDSLGRVPNGRDTNNNETDFAFLRPPTPGTRN